MKDKRRIYKFQVKHLYFVDEDHKKSKFGVFPDESALRFSMCKRDRALINLESTDMSEREIFKEGFSFVGMGIGGLDEQAERLFRKAFNSRRFPVKIIKQFGQTHTKGILLHGPPGTGKTLIARKIANALNCKSIKVVNGPEIFDKYVGGSEEKMRELF